MNRFEKRNTVREIEIFGNTYNVDFGRDEITAMIQNSSNDLNVLEKSAENVSTIIEKQKDVLKKFINEILGNPKATDQIFKDDNTAVLHRDIYTFLVSQYTEVMTEESPYSPKRIK